MTEMDDDEVRELLGRYRPAGPPAALRARALASPVPAARTWPWAAAAVALLAATVGFHAAANRAIATVAEPADPLSMEALADLMGGTEEARRAAALIVEEQRFREWLSGKDAMTRTMEDELNRVD
jgi:hypothetical protein